MAESISSLVLGALNCFKRLSGAIEEFADGSLRASLPPRLNDELARFKVWAGNSGAHRTGRASLEHRLRDASHIRQQVLRLLGDLKESLEDATDILTGKATPWEKTGDEEGQLDDLETSTEVDQIVLDITELVDCLMRLSVSIQNPAPHDRFMSSTFTDTSKYEDFDVQHVRDKFQSIDDYLAQRLGKAMSRRRQYFKYREAHHEKLSYGLNEFGDTNLTEPTLPAPSTHASSIPTQMKQGIPGDIPFDDTQSEGKASATSFATSVSNPKSRKVPPMPEGALKGPVMCPFCYLIISVQDTKSWKKHVFGDLRPYNCLAMHCTAADQEFSKRSEWMQHMLQSHLRLYSCPCGCSEKFLSAAESRNHLLKTHSGAIPPSKVDSIVELSSQPLSQDAHTDCPFCPEKLNSLQQYRRHVGNHQQDLALFILPNIEGEEDDPPTENGEDNASPATEDTENKAERISSEKNEEYSLEKKLVLEDFPGDAAYNMEGANDNDGWDQNDYNALRSRGIKRSASSGKLNPGAKRQHRGDDEEPNESDDEDNDEYNRVQKKRTKTGDGRKFACPFYKFDSERWKNERTCCGPGWYEIHRLKEHLYRTHLLVTCTRCFGHFKSEKLLQKHQRTKDECVWQDESSCVIDVGAGIDSKKEKLLKSRGKAQHGVDQWYEIYYILFPDIKDLPTPWYDAPNSKGRLTNDDGLKRNYEHFLRREIPKVIRQQLVADVKKEFQDLEASVQGRLGSWIKIAAEKCAAVFQSIPTPTEAAALPNPDPQPSSRAASTAAVDVGPSILDTFDPHAYELELPLPENFNFNFDSEIDRFQPPECLPNYDSAYGTGTYGLDGSSETWNAEPGPH